MGEILHNLLLGMETVLTLQNIFWVIFGGLMGTIIGMLPGLGPPTGMAIMIPLVYGMEPASALITLAGIFYGAMFGGSRASIMINTPGDISAIATCFDGYPMTENGEAGKALAASAIASFIGGIFAVILMIFLIEPISTLALRLGPIEMFSVLFFALTATVTLAQDNLIKGFVSMFIGFMIALIGLDPQTGLIRYSFGMIELHEGIAFMTVMIGVYALAEVFKNLADINKEYNLDSSFIGDIWMTKKEFKKCLPGILRSPLGFIIGAIPGLGGSVATLSAYSMEKQFSKNPEKFGKGAIEGVTAPEAANNASATGSMVPLLTLGIPGSATTAIMAGALMMIGVRPGPLLFSQSPELGWGVVASIILGNIFLIIINLPLVVPLVQLLRIPQRILQPLIVGLCFLGVYVLNYSSFDFFLLVIFSVFGYFLKKLDVPLPPLVLALILGGDTEQYFRRAVATSNGDYTVFFKEPISLVFILLSVVIIVYSLRKYYKSKKQVKTT